MSKIPNIPALFVMATVLSVAILITGCSTTLVAPYDDKLVTGTEQFYIEAATMIEEGLAASPRFDADREQISEPENHSAHYTNFEPRYNQLVVHAEALILRAMASSEEIDRVGQELQSRLNELIETTLPSECEEVKAVFGDTSLTAANYIDLKCIITKWKEQHSDPDLTRGKLILKKANWEGRKQVIFNAVLAIQRAEASKKAQ